MRILLKKKPERYKSDLGFTINDLAIVQYKMKKYNESKANYYEALKIIRELSETNPDYYNHYLAIITSNLSYLHSDLKQYDKAKINSLEAVSYYKELVGKYPKVYSSRLAVAYGSLSFYEVLTGDYSKAETYARLGLEADTLQQWININLAHALLFEGKFDEAKSIYQEFKDLDYPNDKTKKYKDTFLEDFDMLEKAGITHPDVARIREILTNP